MTIGILGAGAIGQLLYWQLRRYEPVMFGRSAAPTTLTYTNLDGYTYHQPIQYRHLATADFTDIQLLIITVKAYQVIDAVKPLLTYLPKTCNLLLLHNGMGPHLTLAPLLDGRNLFLGTTSQGALRKQQWHVCHTGKGLTQVGLLVGQFEQPDSAKTIVQPLLDTLEPVQWTEDILSALWQKLAVNAAINPLTAIHDCRNGTLAEAQYQTRISKIVNELIETAKAEQIMLDKTALLKRVYEVIKLTAGNYSSMHQDVSHNRQTEIDSINGFIVQQAKTHNIAVPTNQQIIEQVKSL